MLVLSRIDERFAQQRLSFGEVSPRDVEHCEAVERQNQVFVTRREPLPVDRQRTP